MSSLLITFMWQQLAGMLHPPMTNKIRIQKLTMKPSPNRGARKHNWRFGGKSKWKRKRKTAVQEMSSNYAAYNVFIATFFNHGINHSFKHSFVRPAGRSFVRPSTHWLKYTQTLAYQELGAIPLQMGEKSKCLFSIAIAWRNVMSKLNHNLLAMGAAYRSARIGRMLTADGQTDRCLPLAFTFFFRSWITFTNCLLGQANISFGIPDLLCQSSVRLKGGDLRPAQQLLWPHLSSISAH